MGLLPDSPTSLSITFGLNNIVARETLVEPKPSFSSDTSSQRSSSPSDRLKRNVWPALKKGISSGLAESSRMARNLYENQSSIPESTQLNPVSSQSFSTKRQIALAEVSMIPMAATHGGRMDSPTIPGWFHAHGRSESAPEATTSRNLFERSIQEPVSEPLILFSQQEGIEHQVAGSPDTKLRGIPKSNPTVKHISPASSKSSHPFHKTTAMETEEEDKPPAVPPKSPRLTGHSSTTLPETSSMRNIAFKRNNSSSVRPRAATAMELRPRQHIASELHRRNESAPSVTVSSKEVQQLKSRHMEIKEKHKRTEAVVQSRDRSKRRRSLLGDRTSKQIAVAEKLTWAPLPVGFSIPDAKLQFTSSDVEKLQKQAKSQAEKFKVFQYHEAKALSKELRALDARCEYIRYTSSALRAGRNHFHERVIAHLRSSTHSHESILEQEEALAQIDKSIDEWIAKLEKVDNRRTRVRQMLLEHIAASLVLAATPINIKRPAINNEDDAGFTDIARESIRIYADCGVYKDADMSDLLADIEHQMETMSGHSMVL